MDNELTVMSFFSDAQDTVDISKDTLTFYSNDYGMRDDKLSASKIVIAKQPNGTYTLCTASNAVNTMTVGMTGITNISLYKPAKSNRCEGHYELYLELSSPTMRVMITKYTFHKKDSQSYFKSIKQFIKEDE